MRIFVIIIIFLIGITIDSLTKYYFDALRWQEYCYMGSPLLLQVPPHDIPVGACTYDLRTGSPLGEYVDNRYYKPIIGEYFGFTVSYNTGIAFSLPITGIPLQILTLLIIAYFFYYYIFFEWKKKSRFLDIGFAFILSGAIAHAYERIVIGHVIDFISIKYFAILNFADILISIGAILFILGYMIHDKYRG